MPVLDSSAITPPIQVAEKTETISASDKRSILRGCISDSDATRHRFGFRMFLELRLLSGAYACSYHVLSGRHARFRFLESNTRFTRCSSLAGVIFILHVHFCGRTNRASNKLSAAIRTHETELFRSALQTVGALETADVSFVRIWREIAVAAFAVRP